MTAAIESASDYYSQPGYRGNLTSSQTLALLKLWRRFLRLCETSSTHDPSHPTGARPKPSSAEPYSTSSSASASGDRLQTHGPHDTAASNEVTYDDVKDDLPPQDDRLKDHLRSLEESKDMQDFLRLHGGAALKREFWAMVKGEHPDAVMLRFLRARKWDVDRALAVIGSTCAFRVQYDISRIVKDGELGITRTRGGMNIFRNGISYIYGATSVGEPVYFIEVGSHYSSNQTAEELKRAVVYLQEILSIMMPPPVERKVVIFNLNNFGIRNMDWSTVLFMAKTMESFYPETLARVYVHGAPWIFKPIWSILKPLLDPVVRDKVRLTWKVEELSEHIPADHLPKKTLHGNLDWEFEYPLPQPGENDIQADTEKCHELRLAYLNVVTEFENATRALARSYAATSRVEQKNVGSRIGVRLGRKGSGAESPDEGEPEGSASLRAIRDVLATKLRVEWMRLKPYVVGKTKYDRWNVSRPDGTIRWQYKTLGGKEEVQLLGQGTSLPELERALAEIEGAQPSPLPALSPRPTPSTPPASGARKPLAARSNLATAPVVSSILTPSDDATATTASSHHADTTEPMEAEKEAGLTRPDDAEGTRVKGARDSTSTEEFADVIPVHPSDPSFGRARDADVEVRR